MTSPHQVTREGFRWFPAVVTAGILISLAWMVLALVNGNFWWWLQAQNVKHQYQINQNSQQYQTGYLQKLDNDYQSTLADQETEGQVPASDLPTVKAAVLGDAGSVCYDYTLINTKLTPVAPDIISWVSANCSGPAVSPDSSLRK